MQNHAIEQPAGIERGHEMAARAAERTEREVDHLWIETALTMLQGWVALNRQRGNDPFTMETARVALAGKVARPTDLRAWGHVTRAAIKRGILRRVPGMYSAAASSNGSPKPVYVAGDAAL